MEPVAYLNGEFVPESHVCLPVSDAGVVLGATVSDLMRTFRGKLFRLDDHLDRFFGSLRSARLQIELGKVEVAKIIETLVARNSPLVDEGGELGLVLFVTAGELKTFSKMIDRPRRTGPTVCVHTFPLCFAVYEPAMRNGIRLITPMVRQVPDACWDPQIKCRSRMHYYLAGQEVHAVDPDAVALLLDLNGNVTETGTANFLMVVNGTIVSPPHASVLPGISQAITIELATKLGIPTEERIIPLKNLSDADEAFLASTPYCLAPVTHINGALVGNGAAGPVYRRLIEAWNREVGLDIRAQIIHSA